MIPWVAAAAVGLGLLLLGLDSKAPWPRRAGLALTVLAPLLVIWLEGEAPRLSLFRSALAILLAWAARTWMEGESVEPLDPRQRRGAVVVLLFAGTLLGVAIQSDLGPQSFMDVSPLAAWVTVGLLASTLAGTKWIGRGGPP